MKNIIKLSLIIISCTTLYSAEKQFISEIIRNQQHSGSQNTRKYDREIASITAKSYMDTGRKVPTIIIMDLLPEAATAAMLHNKKLESQKPRT
jgi:hypothetical protein